MFKLQLKEMRKLAKMSQQELADAIGVTRGVIGSWEREEVNLPLDKACDIAKVLKCTLEELAGWEKPRPRPEQIRHYVITFDESNVSIEELRERSKNGRYMSKEEHDYLLRHLDEK